MKAISLLRRSTGLATLSVLLALFVSASAWGQFQIPSLTGPVVDNAGILSPSVRSKIEVVLRTLYRQGGSQINILTVPDLAGETVEQAAIKVFDQWKLGSGKGDNGVLIFMSKADRKLRIEVGQGLEGVLPDAVAKRIIEEQMIPLFRSGDFDSGFLVGVASVVSRTDPDFNIQAALDAPIYKRTSRSDKKNSFLFYLFVFWVIFSLFRGVFGRRRRSSGFLEGVLTGAIASGLGRGGWGGGGRGWGGGGGWSGGGGSSSGGGASGSW